MNPRTILIAAAFIALLVGSSAVTAQPILTLDEAVDQLDETAIELDVARLSVQYAERQRQQALALVRPTLQLDALYQMNDQKVELEGQSPYAPLQPFLEQVYQDHPDNPDLYDPSLLTQGAGGTAVVQPRHDFSGSLTFSQTLFNMRSLPAVRSVTAGVDVARQGVVQTRYQLEGAVIQAYFGAVLAQRVIEVRAQNMELIELAYERARSAFESEVGTRFDVRRAEVDLERASRELANAELGYALAIDGLATLLNIDADFDVEEPAAREVPASREAALTYSDTLPDLVSFELQLERQEYLIRQARAQWYPQVFGQFSVAARRETAFSGDPYSWTLRINAVWMLYDGGARRADRQARDVEALQIELERERTELRIAADLRALELSIQQERENIESARLQRDLATESLALANEARELGAATTLDVDTAREQLALAELQVAIAEVSLQQLLAELAWRQGD